MLFLNQIIIDKKFLYHNASCNKKNVTFFFHNKKVHLINKLSFKRHHNFQCWKYLCSKVFGFNNNISSYILKFIGYNKKIMFTDLDEYYFFIFKSFLRCYSDYLSLSWFLIYLKQRRVLLRFFFRGYRFNKRLPSRGQRTWSNNKTSKHRTIIGFRGFKRKLKRDYRALHFPNWKEINSFYFHRF